MRIHYILAIVFISTFAANAKGQSNIEPFFCSAMSFISGPSIRVGYRNFGTSTAGFKFQANLTANTFGGANNGTLIPEPILSATLVGNDYQPLDQGRLQYTLGGVNNNRIHAEVSVPGPIAGDESIQPIGFIVLNFKKPQTKDIFTEYSCAIGTYFVPGPGPNDYLGGFYGAETPPPGANVPTASEWQLLIFGVLLFGGAVLGARRPPRQG